MSLTFSEKEMVSMTITTSFIGGNMPLTFNKINKC
jgi:hypothetical protein